MPDEENVSTNEVRDQTSQALSNSSSSATSAPLSMNDNQSEPIGSVRDTARATTGVVGSDLSVGIGRSRSSNTRVNDTDATAATGNNDQTSTEVSGVSPVSPQDNATETPQPRRQSIWRNEYCRQVCLVVTYPGMVVVSIIGLIMVLVFCVFPTLLFMGMVICAYYCMNSEPVPLSVLIRDLFVGEDPNRATTNWFPNGSGNGIIDPEKAKADRALYRTKLIVRRLLEVETVPLSCSRVPPTTSRGSGSEKSKSDVIVIDHRSSTPTLGANSDADCINEAVDRLIDKVNLRKHNGPIEIWTDHRILRFSAPLEAPSEDSDDDENGDKKESKDTNEATSFPGSDIEAPEIVPHYRRSSEIELSSGHLREPSPPARSAEFRRLEHDRTPSESSIHLDQCNSSSQSDPGACRNVDESTDAEVPVEESSDNDKHDENCERSDKANCCPVSSPHTDYFGIEDDARDPGTACDICILEFGVGDEIAWSPNLKCSHAFHKDCILDWLVRKPTCPNCRQDYVNITPGETV